MDALPPIPYTIVERVPRDSTTNLKVLGAYALHKSSVGDGSFAHVKKAVHRTSQEEKYFAVKSYHIRSLGKKKRFLNTRRNSLDYTTALEDLYEGIRIMKWISTSAPESRCEILYDTFLALNDWNIINTGTFHSNSNMNFNMSAKLYLVVDYLNPGPVMLSPRTINASSNTMSPLGLQKAYWSLSHWYTYKVSGIEEGNLDDPEYSETLIKCFIRDLAEALVFFSVSTNPGVIAYLEWCLSVHNHDIIHRDIKPENILMEATGRIKLGDFSIATSLERCNSKTTVGTPLFFSPEMCEPLHNQYDHHIRGKASDMWALGVTIWVLFFGTLPFWGYCYQDIFNSITTEFLDLTNRRTISDDAKHCLALLLRKEPTERLTAHQLLNHEWLHDVDYDAAFNYAQNILKLKSLSLNDSTASTC